VSAAAVGGRAIEASGLRLAYEERGEGAPVLLVHGAGVGRALWRETLESLVPAVRAIAYDRRAYGESEAPEPYTGTTVGEQSEDAAAVLRALDVAPAVACGQDLGALVALDLLLRHRDLVRAAVLVEPPALWLAPGGTETMSALRTAMEEGAREGGASAAVDAYLEGVAGPRAREVLGPERLAGSRSDARAVLADFSAAPSWSASRHDLAGLDAPVVVLAGASGSGVWREAARGLAGMLRGAHMREVEGAGHLLPIEAPDAVMGAIADLAGV
jgi:pimeloyl-ACP methyl ester carboxylesterase